MWQDGFSCILDYPNFFFWGGRTLGPLLEREYINYTLRIFLQKQKQPKEKKKRKKKKRARNALPN